MFSSFVLNSSSLYLVLAFLFSISLSYFLYFYYKDDFSVPFYIKMILFVIRAVSIFLLCVILLDVEWKKKDKIIESPIIVFLQDNSSSIVNHSDSLFYKIDYVSYIDSLIINSNSQIDLYNFGMELEDHKTDFKSSSTNIASSLVESVTIYDNLNVSAYILASDGLYNEGYNPVYSSANLSAPLYTIGLGDTLIYKDISIASIRHNEISYLGNESPVEVILDAQDMEGSIVDLNVYDHKNDPLKINPVFKEKILITNNNFYESISFFITPNSSNVNQFTVVIESDEIEKNKDNNKRIFFIDVIDDRKKILLLFASPHPDIAAIKSSLNEQDEYELETYRINDFLKSFPTNEISKNLEKYDLIISHQLPSYNDDILFYLDNVPVWHIVAKNTNLSKFNSIQKLIEFDSDDSDYEFIQPNINKSFSSFIMSDSLTDIFSTALLTPSMDFTINNILDVAFFQSPVSSSGQKPIFFFGDSGSRDAILLGEGLWRFRLMDSYLNGSNHLFNNFINKITQYLIIDTDKSRFRLNYNNVQSPNQKVIFNAELYNPIFELINNEDIIFNLFDSLGNQFNYSFVPFDNKYSLDLGYLQSGKYNFIAKVFDGSKELVNSGSFQITNIDKESQESIANHVLLSNLSSKYGGDHIIINSKKDLINMNNLINDIENSATHKKVVYFNNIINSLINFKLTLILILIFLCADWLIRRIYINY